MNRRTRIALIIIVIVLFAALSLLLLTWMSRGNITSQQAKSIAYGLALRDCIEQRGAKADCRRMNLDKPALNCGEWYCKDAPYWSINYRAGDYSGTVYLDLIGNSVDEADLSSL